MMKNEFPEVGGTQKKIQNLKTMSLQWSSSWSSPPGAVDPPGLPFSPAGQIILVLFVIAVVLAGIVVAVREAGRRKRGRAGLSRHGGGRDEGRREVEVFDIFENNNGSMFQNSHSDKGGIVLQKNAGVVDDDKKCG